MAISILLVEDNTEIATSIVDFLASKGHCVDYAATAKTAKNLLKKHIYNVAILDVMLPGMSGLDLCKEIRNTNSTAIPIIMLTARDTLDDIVNGFDSGADDYLTKPFAMQELYVRINALARRNLLNHDYKISLGPLVVDRRTHEIFREGVPIKCTKMGFDILEMLAEAYPKVVTRTEIMKNLWGDEFTESDALRSHMYQLRKILDKPFSFPILKTVHSIGFTYQNVE